MRSSEESDTLPSRPLGNPELLGKLNLIPVPGNLLFEAHEDITGSKRLPPCEAFGSVAVVPSLDSGTLAKESEKSQKLRRKSDRKLSPAGFANTVQQKPVVVPLDLFQNPLHLPITGNLFFFRGKQLSDLAISENHPARHVAVRGVRRAITRRAALGPFAHRELAKLRLRDSPVLDVPPRGAPLQEHPRGHPFQT